MASARTRTKIETGGSDAPEFDFTSGDLVGTYAGARTVKTKYGVKFIHTFHLLDPGSATNKEGKKVKVGAGDEVMLWGVALIDNALIANAKDVKAADSPADAPETSYRTKPGTAMEVVKTGNKIAVAGGKAWEYEVFTVSE